MPQPRTVVILQARVGSSRLPGKVLAPILGRPMLAILLERVRTAHLVHQVVVATTNQAPDDEVAALCRELSVECFRGHPTDCLDRYYQAAALYGAEIIVRLTGDNPLVAGSLVDECVERFTTAQPAYDYFDTGNAFPRGLSVEVFSRAVLNKAWKEDETPETREHVTPYIYNHPDQFRCGRWSSGEDWSHLRWTVDTEEDLKYVRRIFQHFGRIDFDWREILAATKAQPGWERR